MNLVKDNSYQLRTIIRPASDYKGKVTALLLSEQGEVLASAPVDITAAGQWNDLSWQCNLRQLLPKESLLWNLMLRVQSM